MKTTSTLSCTCPKCQGTGKIDFSELDGGTCFKCNGNGYIGEMPNGWAKKLDSKKWRNAASQLICSTLSNLQFNGKIKYTRSYEMYDYTIEALMLAGYSSMRFRKNGVFSSAPEMTFLLSSAKFGQEFVYEICITSDLVIVNCVKNLEHL
jgi:RecJ-like exonuclease